MAPFTLPEMKLAILDASGEEELDMDDPWQDQGGYFIRPGGGYHRLGLNRDTANGTIPTFTHNVLDVDLNSTSLDTIPMDPLAQRYVGWLAVDENDHLIVVSGVDPIDAPGTLHRMRFLRLDPTGEETVSRWYEGGYYDPYDLEVEADGYRVLFAATTLGPFGATKVLHFDTDFNYTGGFAIPTLGGQPYQLGDDSLGYVSEMVLTPAGGAIVSQWLIPSGGSAIAESWLVRYTADGTMTHSFHSPSQTMNTELVVRSLTQLPDGTVLWAYRELGSSQADPNFRVHVYRVDMDLNQLGHYVLDGTADGLYYEANALSIMTDGGILLSGTAYNLMNVSAHPYGFVAKLGGFTAVPEAATTGTQILGTYPNPGTQGFTVQLPTAQTTGTLAVYDGRGALVHTMRVASGPVTVDAATWPAGLYVVRATALDGRPIGSSVWAKE